MLEQLLLVDEHRDRRELLVFPGDRIDLPLLLERQGDLDLVVPCDRLEAHVALRWL